MRMARAVNGKDSSGCCDICETIAQENEIWAPHMPCKELSKKRKKKKKKKKKKRSGLAELGPSPEELLALHQSRQVAAAEAEVTSTDDSISPPPTKRVCAGLEVGGEGMMLGMDLKPEQTLRPTLQHHTE